LATIVLRSNKMTKVEDVATKNKIQDETNNNHISLVEAMKTADSIRSIFLKRKDPTETEALLPPGTWQGGAAFITAGLLFSPFRRTILKITGPRGPFQSFVDLVITPLITIASVQVGLVIGPLYGSFYYLDRVATIAASEGAASVQSGQDTTTNVATATELCQEMLSLTSSSSPIQSLSSQWVTFGSWDPRAKTMESLTRALENCQRREDTS